MLIFQIWKETIEEISYSVEIEIIELLLNIIGAIVLTILCLPADIILFPIELITFIVYKILKKKRR